MVKNVDKVFAFNELPGSHGMLVSPYNPKGRVIPKKVLSNEIDMGGIER